MPRSDAGPCQLVPTSVEHTAQFADEQLSAAHLLALERTATARPRS